MLVATILTRLPDGGVDQDHLALRVRSLVESGCDVPNGSRSQ